MQWALQLGLSGLSKIGWPGVVIVEGPEAGCVAAVTAPRAHPPPPPQSPKYSTNSRSTAPGSPDVQAMKSHQSSNGFRMQ